MCATYSESLVLIPECRIRAVNRHRNTFNLFAIWKESVNDVRVHFRWFKRENGYKPFLYDITLDICQFLRRANNPVASHIYEQFREFSNLMDVKCPIAVSLYSQKINFSHKKNF